LYKSIVIWVLFGVDDDPVFIFLRRPKPDDEIVFSDFIAKLGRMSLGSNHKKAGKFNCRHTEKREKVKTLCDPGYPDLIKRVEG